MSEIKIDKGVKVPEKRSAMRYPFREMEIGDSFFIAGKTSKKSGFYSIAKLIGIKIVTRNVTEDFRDGVRVWRVE